jgi:hypothetical protein
MSGVSPGSTHRYKTWAEAAGQPETATRLDGLPKGVSFPDDFPEPIRFDPVRKLLIYRGFMSSVSYRFLHGLNSDPAFLAALDVLFLATAYAQAGQGRRLWPWLLGVAGLAAAGTVAWLLLR